MRIGIAYVDLHVYFNSGSASRTYTFIHKRLMQILTIMNYDVRFYDFRGETMTKIYVLVINVKVKRYLK